MLKAWLAHPLTRDLDIDSPETTHLRHQIIQEKGFLQQIYREWYTAIVQALPKQDGFVLELGSGAGFLNDFVPDVITSELFPCPGINIVLDGQQLPFADTTLRGIVMTNVLHHLPYPRRFFSQATRTVRPGGVIVMIEPWVTTWSRLIYSNLHHEPFSPEAQTWEFASSGSLSGANGALPWIMFERDRSLFEQQFPEWRVQTIDLKMPFCYLLSGGVSQRSLMPGWSFRGWCKLEYLLQPWIDNWAMFAQIVLVRSN